MASGDVSRAGAIADALEPLPDMVALWLGLARGVGLLVAEPSGERIVAAGEGQGTRAEIEARLNDVARLGYEMRASLADVESRGSCPAMTLK